MAITTEEIIEAADLLVERGEKPTLLLVRKTVGGGSYTTISEGLGVWRQRRQAAELVQRAPVPEGIITDSQALISKLWDQAQDAAQDRLDDERKALAEAREKMEAESREATRLADDLAIEVDEAKAKLVEAEERIKALSIQAQEAQQEISKLNSELTLQRAAAEKAELRRSEAEAAASERSGRLEAAQERISELESSLSLERDRLAEAGKVKAVAESLAQERAEVSTREIEAARRQAAEAQAEAAELRGKLAAIQEQQEGQQKEGTAQKTRRKSTGQESG